MPTVVGSMFGSTRVAVAMGMVVTGWAGGYLMGAPIAGYILNAFGGEEAGFKAYRPAMYDPKSLLLFPEGSFTKSYAQVLCGIDVYGRGHTSRLSEVED
jgi:MFS family permease